MKKTVYIFIIFLLLNLLSNMLYTSTVIRSFDFKSYTLDSPSIKMLIPKWNNS